ncbi:MAG: dihydroorotase [Bacteroidaceae bacterium]|nr:dihydroorotase [Bacteroidaceae bacterium]
MTTLIRDAVIVNEGKRQNGSMLIDGEQIAAILPAGTALPEADRVIDAQGALLLPGIIDDHVHLREPGLTHKADTAGESRAALAGGVTGLMDMPNVVPQTTTNALWAERMAIGARECRTNYAYYLGATNDNIEEIKAVDRRRVPAIKLFMGSSTGNMLVDDEQALRQIFSQSPLPIMAHCEDTGRINQRMKEAQAQWGDDPAVETHAWIRDAEACYQSAALAARLAHETGARLHIAHLSTERELELVGGNITAEACVGHLVFCDEDYATLDTRIKVNPAIKSRKDRDALRQALKDGRITLVATDHAPHLLSDKHGGARTAASGMPMVQFSLVSMLNLVDEGFISIERLVELMCHAPASLYNIEKRGFLRPGYQADITLVERTPWTLQQKDVLSKCGWSPLEGRSFSHRVAMTFVNGRLAYDHGTIHDEVRGQALTFNR